MKSKAAIAVRWAIGFSFFFFIFLSLNRYFNYSSDNVELGGYGSLTAECKQSLVGGGLYMLADLRRVSDRETFSRSKDKGLIRYWMLSSGVDLYPSGWVCTVRFDASEIITDVSLSFKPGRAGHDPR